MGSNSRNRALEMAVGTRRPKASVAIVPWAIQADFLFDDVVVPVDW